MWNEIDNLTTSNASLGAASLPAGVVLAERAAGALRAYLAEHGLHRHLIFSVVPFDLFDIDNYLAELGVPHRWDALPAFTDGGEAFATASVYGETPKLSPVGALRFRAFDFVLARWNWIDTENGGPRSTWLVAAPSAEHFRKLRDAVLNLRRAHGEQVWQVIRGGYDEPERIPRAQTTPEMFVSEAIEQRVQADVVRFFTPAVKALYDGLSVPYRRGVLLYGPPGNGKTSLIRRLGMHLPDVPGLILKPAAGFDSDDLEAVIKRWTDQSPAMLVIEDLNWLLKAVNVSTFLNALDGIEPRGGGALLIATTNHPDQLDPAINNRPGRFDVSIEVPNPDATLRRRFFTAKLPGFAEEVLATVIDRTKGLSFAHLQEIVRLSGMLAIDAGRDGRIIDDVSRAVHAVSDSNDAADRGFMSKPEAPFGLAALRRK